MWIGKERVRKAGRTLEFVYAPDGDELLMVTGCAVAYVGFTPAIHTWAALQHGAQQQLCGN